MKNIWDETPVLPEGEAEQHRGRFYLYPLKTYVVVCDTCLCTDEWLDATLKDAKDTAKSYGWKTKNGKWICSECAK